MNFGVSVHQLIVSQTSPILVRYMLYDKKRVDELNLKHFLTAPDPFGIVKVTDPKIAEEFMEVLKLYETIASGEDVVRLKLLILQEVKRMLEERLSRNGSDYFSKPLPLQ